MKREFHIYTVVLYSAFTNYVANSTSNITLPTNSQFLNIYNDLNTIINTNQSSQINIEIYNDASGQNLVINKVVTNINYSYPYDDVKNEITINYPGKLSIIFNDGSLFQITDQNESSTWYSLNGLPIKGLT